MTLWALQIAAHPKFSPLRAILQTCWFGGSSFRFVLAPGFGVEQQRSTVADAEEQRFVCWQSLRVWGRDFVVRNLDTKDTKIVVPLVVPVEVLEIYLETWKTRGFRSHAKMASFFFSNISSKRIFQMVQQFRKKSVSHSSMVTRLGPISHSWDLQKTKACKKRSVKPPCLQLVVGESKHDFHISGMIISNIPKWSVNTPTIPNTSLWMIIWILGDDHPKFPLIRWFLMEKSIASSQLVGQEHPQKQI